MSDTILSIENVSKQYQLGTFGTGTIGRDVDRWFRTKIMGKEDPYLKIGQTNDRTSKEKADFVWALKDINFEVKRGEVLGIIGKNGAGKSTLLKLLSRVTGPTTGAIRSAGRMASLLEVGTGFHPELTGLENIYLNGAILGMTKAEIKRKLDEIIDFSGCAMYIDTPTKRYSSGMTVRLGFAVAAFLDPEILVVDEVLAVGDAEFQKKAIGKMRDVSRGEGRTVLFVSHNMASVKSLCQTGLLLENGTIKATGQIDDVVKNYLGGDSDQINLRHVNATTDGFSLHSCGIRNAKRDFSDSIYRDEEMILEFHYTNNANNDGYKYFNIKIKDDEGRYLVTTISREFEQIIQIGNHKAQMVIPAGFFNEGSFSIDLMVLEKNDKGYKSYLQETDILMFQVLPEARPLGSWMGKEVGYIRHTFNWQ